MKRIYHTWEKWECYLAGFYESRPGDNRTTEQCEREYMELLSDATEFWLSLCRVLTEWPTSCEHYLSNDKMNRIAWLGQASLCITRKIPSTFRGGFNRLPKSVQDTANQIALHALNKWLATKGEAKVTLSDAGINAKADIY